MAGTPSHLNDLPSRGLFCSPILFSSMGGLRPYICDKETTPPADQIIRTDQTNILIRSLTLKKQNCEQRDAKAKLIAEIAKGKRPAERPLDKPSSKRTSKAHDSSCHYTGNDSDNYHRMTVERLRSLLRAKGLSTKGKKGDLLGRLSDYDEMTNLFYKDESSKSKPSD